MISDFMHLNVPDERLVDQDRRKHRRKRRQSSDRSTLKQSSAFTRAPTFTFTRAALRLCVNGLCSPSAARQLDLDWRNHPCSRHRLPYSLFLIHTNALSLYLSIFLSLSVSLSLCLCVWCFVERPRNYIVLADRIERRRRCSLIHRDKNSLAKRSIEQRLLKFLELNLTL